MQTITVPLGERSYPIHIERGLLAKTGEMIRENLGDIAVAVVSDDHVAPLYMEEVVSSMEKVGLRVCSIVLPHGEQTKCLKSLETLYAFLCEHHLTRKDAIVALGGGAAFYIFKQKKADVPARRAFCAAADDAAGAG